MHVTRAYTPAAFILDLQKAFDTNNQNILLAKLNHYGIKGTSFDWFKPFICDRVQYISIDLKESLKKLWSSTRFSTWSSAFYCFINDLNKSVKNSKVHHHADDTRLLLTEKPLKKINKQITICRWLRANKDSGLLLLVKLIIYCDITQAYAVAIIN